jgi:exosortase A
MLLGLLVVAWVFLFLESLSSAIGIWYTSEIFNHCFFIIPGALYLFYRQKHRLLDCTIKPNYWLLTPIFGLLSLYALGLAGDVQLFMHIATFCSLPLLLWMLLGNQIARILAFPLGFIMFSIPLGEELIPWLQQVTADISVSLLTLTGVPIFRTGLYIEIPGGRFLVAEACSGISFFISSIVIGLLYTHLNIRGVKKKTAFIIISIVYPIIANALRVYGIILTAYLTDMEYAAGADHIIYGGVFFSIVIISLLFIGELFRDKSPILPVTSKEVKWSYDLTPRLIIPTTVTIVILVLFQFWYSNIEARLAYVPSAFKELKIPSYPSSSPDSSISQWTASYKDAEQQINGMVRDVNGKPLDYFLAYYATGKGELISSLNRLYHQDDWTIVAKKMKKVSTKEGTQEVYVERLSNPNGVERFLASWHVVDGKPLANRQTTKLYQISRTLLGQKSDGGIVALSQQIVRGELSQEEEFLESVGLMFDDLSAAFP